MKKKRLLIVLLLTLLGLSPASADIVTPYTEDFNTSISTSAHDFSVGKGWGHITDYYFDDESYDQFYPTYTYSSTDGRDGTGALKVSDQTNVGEGWNTGYTYDLLVTPPIVGKSSIYVKKTSNTGTVKFYTVTEKNGKLTRGSSISVDLPTLSTSEYVKVDIPRQDSTRIGIYASNVWIDDFQADTAVFIKKKALMINKVTNVLYRGERKGEEDVDAKGNFGIKFLVSLINKGDVDFAPGDEHYSLSIKNYEDSIVATVPITEPLPVDSTLTDYVLQVELPYATYPLRDRYDVVENISNTSSYGAWIEPVPYKAVPSLSDSKGNIDAGTLQAFGMIKTAVTKSYTLNNRGGAPLIIDSIGMPEGFTTSLQAKDTIAAHQSKDFTITATTETSGVHSGNMVLKISDTDDYILPLSSTVLDSTKMFIDFEDGKFPQGFIVGKNWKVEQRDYNSSDNVYLAASDLVDDTKLITPLLKVQKGEKMSLDVAKTGYYSSDSHLRIYYSTDRAHWTLAKTITASDIPSTRSGSSRYFFSDLKNFVVDSIPAGNYYIAFESGYAAIDNIYGFERVPVEHDAYFKDVKIPAQGVVNNPYTATATLFNNNSKDEQAGSYKVELQIDGKTVATDSASVVKADSISAYTFTFVPHKAGSYKAVIVFRAGEYVIKTDTADVTISQETSNAVVQAGTVAGSNMSYTTPISVYYKYSVSDVIYTEKMLKAAGLKKGDKITRISFKGYNTAGDVSSDVKAWIGNTPDTLYASDYVVPDTSRLTKITDTNYTVPKIGSDQDHQVLLSIDLPEGFVYNGQSIHMVMGSALTTTYKRAMFEYSTDNLLGFSKRNDSRFEWSTATAVEYMPVPYFTVEREPATVSGLVKGKLGHVANAHLTLRNGDVLYEATSDSTGQYKMNVVQSDKKYALTVTADGYLPYTDSISFDSMNVVKDVELTLVPDTIVVPASGWVAYSNSHAVVLGDVLPAEATFHAVIGVYESSAVTKQLPQYTVIPANQGVLIKAPAGTYVFPRHDMDINDSTQNAKAEQQDVDNLLLPTSDSAFVVTGGDSIYVLDVNASNAAGFRKAAADEVVPAHSAYLVIKEAHPQEFYPLKDVVLTRISNAHPSASGLDVRKPMYDLSGRRVTVSYKGIVVQEGKKYILR
ncbi:MAG: hypothetical protein SPL43_01810 [Prevotella sp.]|nr:hypothetical protein [Prevotella sp.]